MPVEHSRLQKMVLGWHKEDFDITAAVAAAIALAVTSTAVSGIAFSQLVVTASMVGKLSDEVATALNIQNNINAMIQLGILNLNHKLFRINETRVPSWAGDQIFQGLQLAGQLIKEWSSTLTLGLLALGTGGFTLFPLCRFCRQQVRD